MSDDFLKERRQSLEEEFFRRQNKTNLEKLKSGLQAEGSREALKRASGMEDDAVLDQMLANGLTGETVAALSLIPLIHVAWADGKIQAEEREAILRGAEAKGIKSSSPAWEVLSGWLDEPPADPLFEAWKSYIQALGANLLTKPQFELLESQILGFARGVAAAAGGFLGIGKIANAEDEALSRIQAAFKS